MTSTPLDRLKKVQADPQKEYKALVRSLKYTEGFGLLFIQCSPAEGNRLIERVQIDLPQKQIEVLSLTEPVETLYDKVDQIYRKTAIDALFIQGLEHSLYDYEKHRLWSDDAERLNYSETGIPRLLQHLNLGREKFRDSFPFQFVFLVPPFVLKYLIRRAPDFFDWNSGVLEFSMDRDNLQHESTRTTIERWNKEGLGNFSPDECRKNLIEVQALIEEPFQTAERKADLFFEQGLLLVVLEEFESAIKSFDKVLQLQPGNDSAWIMRGFTLLVLERYEEAIVSYDKVLQFRPDNDSAWIERGVALAFLGRHEEEIASYDKALQYEPENNLTWYNRGNALISIGHYEEAIANYDKALQFKPDKGLVWFYRGDALFKLGHYAEAIASYDKIQSFEQIQLGLVFYMKANCYALQSNLEETIANLSQAIALDPEYREVAKTDADFDAIRDKEEFQALIAEP
jgi:tetratricopeptide (TPR) repeat protein